MKLRKLIGQHKKFTYENYTHEFAEVRIFSSRSVKLFFAIMPITFERKIKFSFCLHQMKLERSHLVYLSDFLTSQIFKKSNKNRQKY